MTIDLTEATEPDAIKATLEKSVKALARARMNEALAKDSKIVANELLQETPAWLAHEDAVCFLKTAKAETKEHYDNVAILATDLFTEIGEKKIVDGVQVIEKNDFDIVDEVLAMRWCKEHLPVAIVRTINEDLVRAAIEAMPEAQRPSFFRVGKKPAIRIASDLSSWLEDDEEI
jgi:hypothetical protein